MGVTTDRFGEPEELENQLPSVDRITTLAAMVRNAYSYWFRFWTHPTRWRGAIL
jgi:hypothetical protein